MAAKSGRGAFLFAGIAAVALVAFFGWKYFRTGAFIDDTALSGALESALNDRLSQAGVTDIQVRREQRVERRQMFPVPRLWIETQREVHLEKSRVPSLVSSLKAVSANQKFTFFESSGPHGDGQQTIEFSRSGRVYHRIIFLISEPLRRRYRARAAIVIDDVAGRPSDLESLNAFLALGIPITYAVLPEVQNADIIMARIRRFGGEIILHQPMEPDDAEHNAAGPSALLTDMSEEQMRARLKKSLRIVPYAQGISNHMGSKFTRDPDAMRRLARAMKQMSVEQGKKPLFFFDSHTTPDSAAELQTSRAGVDYLENRSFMDNQDELEYVVKQLRLLKKMALKDGSAAGIGHIHRKFTAEAIGKVLPEFRAGGVKFVVLSELLKSGAGK